MGGWAARRGELSCARSGLLQPWAVGAMLAADALEPARFPGERSAAGGRATNRDRLSGEAELMSEPRKPRRRRDARSGAGAFLSSSAIVNGDPRARRNLIIEGTIDARVPLDAHGVAIARTGRVRADIYAATIRVEGEVVGDLFGHAQVTVCSSGSVSGRITAPDVIVEDGARLEGWIVVEQGPALPQPSAHEPTELSTTRRNLPLLIDALRRAGAGRRQQR